MKILYVASVYRHLTAFHIPYIKYFQNLGYEVWAAGIGSEDKKILENHNVKCFDIPFSRSPLNFQNIIALNLLKKLFSNESFDLIHVHTPIAAFISRIAYRTNKQGKIIYTAHGFHFFNGAPKKNWLIYYTAEKMVAKWTDHLITINNEDFNNAQKLLPKKKVSLVHGVGVEFSQVNLSNIEKVQLKKQLGLAEESVVVSYIAELNQNKNHRFLLENWKQIKKLNTNIELLIIGTGDKEKELKYLVDAEQLLGVHFLGYRRDVPLLLQITDIVTLLSYREGLPKSIMEAMVAKIPCIVTNTRGLRDLIKSNENGFVINHKDDLRLINAFITLSQSKQLRHEMGQKSKHLIEPYLLDNVIEEYSQIYSRLLK